MQSPQFKDYLILRRVSEVWNKVVRDSQCWATWLNAKILSQQQLKHLRKMVIGRTWLHQCFTGSNNCLLMNCLFSLSIIKSSKYGIIFYISCLFILYWILFHWNRFFFGSIAYSSSSRTCFLIELIFGIQSWSCRMIVEHSLA